MHNATRKYSFKLKGTLIALALGSLAGCAHQPPASFQSFTPEDLNAKLRSGYYTQKVDNFLVILDSSSSTGLSYESAGFQGDSVEKFDVEKEFLRRMNLTIPNLKLNSGIRSFGLNSCTDWSFTTLNAPMAPYSPSGFQSNLDALDCTGGSTPLAVALDASAGELQSTSGKVAVIVVSDGNARTRNSGESIRQLKQQLGDRLCLHTVWVGNPDDQAGKDYLNSLPSYAECGTASAVADIVSPAGAADFVTKVFLKHGEEKPVDDCAARDNDGDGVNDCLDKCPNTPKGAKVNNMGCWVLTNVLFDVDKAIIKPVSFAELNEAVKVFQDNPGLRVEVDGHTDSDASDEHNMGLSQRRAKAVREYLISHGVAADRLTARGFGESQPIATNATPEGKALNRRVELNVIK